jgi:hypothetical protein
MRKTKKQNKPMYLVIANYVIENQVSKTHACKHFAITKRMLKDHMITLRNCNYLKYRSVMRTFKENPSGRGDLPTYLGVCEYVKNVKADKYDVCRKFNITDKSLYDSLRYLNKRNSKLYNSVKDILEYGSQM